jgi:hypothetical protein
MSLPFTPPASFSDKLRIPKFEDMVKDLLNAEGKDFEKAVCTAFNFLDFDASLTQSTQAESDVIAEAYYAEKRYFIVIECQARAPQNQVGIDKVGQIRGNAEAYSLDPRRQQLFETSHKLIVGRPAFSSDARRNAHPDVGLITATNLAMLMLHHRQLSYSQDELKEALVVSGEIANPQITSFQQRIMIQRQFPRKLDIYTLIYVGLLEDPFSDNLEKRKNWVSSDIVVGTVLFIANLLRIPNLTKDEVADAMRDLDNPFVNILRRRVNAQGQVEVRLSTISRPMIQTSSEFGKQYSNRIVTYIEKLRSLGQPSRWTGVTPI